MSKKIDFNGWLISSSWLIGSSIAVSVLIAGACSSDGTSVMETDETTIEETPDETPSTVEETPGENPSTGGTPSVVFSCEEIATKFVTRGSVNTDLPDPVVSAVCSDDTVTVTSNGIPDFPYFELSPGTPSADLVDYTFPATPAVADAVTAIPIVGEIGVAINGIPIYGATEGPGGDVLARPGGFTECGGHNGPTGYHYHILSVVGSDYCLFTEAETTAEPKLFGYALDGYPIYTGNTQYTSSWYLNDSSLFATDTWTAHVYSEGSGDLDQCNGRTDEEGNYAYYTTEGFPYTLGFFRGVVNIQTETQNGGPAR